MKKLSDDQIKFIVQRLKEGKQEAELVYAGKERDIDIITETMAVPLQRVKGFGKFNFILKNLN